MCQALSCNFAQVKSSLMSYLANLWPHSRTLRHLNTVRGITFDVSWHSIFSNLISLLNCSPVVGILSETEPGDGVGGGQDSGEILAPEVSSVKQRMELGARRGESEMAAGEKAQEEVRVETRRQGRAEAKRRASQEVWGGAPGQALSEPGTRWGRSDSLVGSGGCQEWELKRMSR